MRSFTLAVLGTAALSTAMLAQGSAPAPAAPSLIKSGAEVEAALSKADVNSLTGGIAAVYKGVVVRRRSAGSPQFAIIHPHTFETYQILEGSATLVTGGTLTPPLTDNGPNIIRSMAITGGESRKVAKGDIVVTPAGTPHWFSQIDGTITYFEVTYEAK